MRSLWKIIACLSVLLYFNELGLAPRVIGTPSVAITSEPRVTIRVGVFWLFNITTIQAQAGELLSIRPDGPQADLLLDRDQLLSVQRTPNGLACSITSQSGQILRQWQTANLLLESKAPNQAIRLTIPKKISRNFRGRISLSIPRPSSTAPPTGIRVILETDAESVVASAVASELPLGAANQALAAQAVVARSYMASHLRRHAAEGFDFCDSTHCQLFKGENDDEPATFQETAAARQAASETKGLILAYQGKPVEAYFTAACGGISTTPEAAWGTPESNSYRYQPVICNWCRASAHYRWRRVVSAGRLFAAISGATGTALGSRTELQAEADSAGFVHGLTITDGTRRLDLPVSRFRHIVGQTLGWNVIISNAFSIERQGSEFVIRGRGFGHNVGLCVEGARRQAAAGRNWRTILKFYFPGTEISNQAGIGE